MSPQLVLFIAVMGGMVALLGNLFIPDERPNRRRR